MADYKEIIEDVIGKVADKVKNYTDGKSAKEICEAGMEKVSGYGKRALLSFDLAGAKEQKNEAFTEIGRMYYEKCKDKPEEDFAELFAAVAALEKEIEEKEKQVEEIKNGEYSSEKDIDVEIVEYGEVVDNFENKD